MVGGRELILSVYAAKPARRPHHDGAMNRGGKESVFEGDSPAKV